MGAPWILVKSFIREATEETDFSLVADIATAYSRLRTIQRGHFTSATSAANDGTVQISSKIGESEFHFMVPQSMDRASIIELAETALELIEGKTVAQARALLTRRKTSVADFRTLRHDA